MSEEVDNFMRTISLLTRLRESIEEDKEHNDISESHVIEFHNILSNLISLGIRIEDFKISDSELIPRPAASTSSGSSHSETKYVPKSVFLTKLDSILNYLNSIVDTIRNWPR